MFRLLFYVFVNISSTGSHNSILFPSGSLHLKKIPPIPVTFFVDIKIFKFNKVYSSIVKYT